MPTCGESGGRTKDGKPCSRKVSVPGERCFSHPAKKVSEKHIIYMIVYETRHEGWKYDVVTKEQAEEWATKEDNSDIYPISISVSKGEKVRFTISPDTLSPYEITQVDPKRNTQTDIITIDIGIEGAKSVGKKLSPVIPCKPPPGKGGMSIAEVKEIAKKMGIDVKGMKKDQICDAIERKVKTSPKAKLRSKVKTPPKVTMTLLDAISINDIKIVKFLLTKQINPAMLNKAVLLAVGKGYTKIIQLLLDEGADIHANNDGALRLAVDHRNVHVIRFLLDKGADVHSNNDLALIRSTEGGHTGIVRLLVEKGADIHADNDRPFMNAAESGKVDMVEFLINKGVNIHTNDDLALRLAVLSHHVGVTEFLLDRGANIHANDDEALKTAVAGINSDMVQLLLDRGANIHANNDEPLRIASPRGNVGIVQILLDRGANIHANDDDALQQTAMTIYIGVVRLLLNRGANIHANSDFALRQAVRNNDIDMIRLLIEKGADVNVLQKEDRLKYMKKINEARLRSLAQQSASFVRNVRTKEGNIFVGDKQVPHVLSVHLLRK